MAQRSIFSGLSSAISRGLTGIRSAVRRGLDTLGVSAMLQRVGLAPPPEPDPNAPSRAPRGAPPEARAAWARMEEQLRREALQERQQYQARIDAEVARERARIAQEAYYRNLPRSLPPYEGTMEVQERRQLRRYHWVVELIQEDLGTGVRSTRHVTVTSGRLLSRQEIEDLAADLGDEYGRGTVAVRIDHGRQAGPAGTVLE